MKKYKYFKIDFPNGRSLAVVSKNGYAGLIDLCSGVDGKAYITQISFIELVRFAISSGK